MTNIDKAKEYLRIRLGRKVKNPLEFNEWLDALFNEEMGRVLGLNLYIDLKSDSIDLALVTRVIDSMVTSVSDPRDRFCYSIEDENNQAVCVCQHSRRSEPVESDRYVRILPLDDMIEYYFRYAMALPSSSTYAAQSKVLRLFFNPVKSARKGLGVIKKTWQGRMVNVWVTSKNELDALRPIARKRNLADVVANNLGYDGLVSGDQLVGIIYPVSFDHLESHIPTTLDAHVGCRFFLPFADVALDWGLTCCLNDIKPGSKNLKERVHKPIDGLTDEFEGDIIGDITEDSSPDYSHLYAEALRRASDV
jgi:hypothetical protein